MTRSRIAVLLCVPFLALAAGVLPKAGKTVPVLLPAGGQQPDDASSSPAIAGSGGVVVFATEASNLVPGDHDGLRDIAAVNLRNGAARCVSLSTTGEKANGACGDPALDRRGRHVAFASQATNLVADDTNGVLDIFVRDMKLGTTVRVSVAGDGAEANDVSEQPWMSANGRYVLFASRATNLVPDDNNGVSDIFMHDLHTSETRRLSVGQLGAEANGGSFLPKLSANGRFVAFLSHASNLVDVDANSKRDVFVRDLKTGLTEMVSRGAFGPSDGNSGTFSISANGRKIVFDSEGGNLVADEAQFMGKDVFLRDRKKGVTTLISKGFDGTAADGYSEEPVISANGRWVAFTSLAGNIVPGDQNESTDVFRLKLKTGAMQRVSLSTLGVEGDANSGQASLTRSGRFVAFATRASNLFDAFSGGEWLVALRRP